MMWNLIILIAITFSQFTGAQEVIPTTTTKKPKQVARWSFAPRFTFWQEEIEASEAGSKTDFHSQVFGVSLGATRTMPWGSRSWMPYYGGDLSFGTIKANGSSAGHVDSLKNQPWYGVGATAGIAYRPSGNSEIRAALPVGFRLIEWKSSRSTLDLSKDQSFTIGMSLISATKMSKNAFLVAGLTHLYLWNSTQWQAGVDFLF